VTDTRLSRRPDNRLDDGIRRLAIGVLTLAIEGARGTGRRANQAHAWLHGRSFMLEHWRLAAGRTREGVQRWLARIPTDRRPAWPPRRFDEDDEAA